VPLLPDQVEECQVKTTHPWEQCVFAHPTENARRRNPLTHVYIAEPCPDYKNGLCLLVSSFLDRP
jgi:hypothetical protein